MRSGLIAIALAGALFVGCGDGGSDAGGQDATTTVTVQQKEPLTKAEFIGQADTICADAEEELRPLSEQLQELEAKSGSESEQNLKDLATVLRAFADLVEAEASDLRALTPPPGDESIVNEYLGVGEQGTIALRDLADAVGVQDQEEAERLSVEISGLTQRGQGLAGGYGFEECGSGD